MRVFAIVAAILLAGVPGCRQGAGDADHQAEWREVLRRKHEAAGPDAPPERKQVWADSVRAFVEKHPGHSRAREVWSALQLEFADDLMAMGRVHQAAAFYRAVLLHDPDNAHAQRGWETAASRLAITREKLAAVELGMREHEVAAALGRPLPGWTHRVSRLGATFEAWYYRIPRGVAAVHFRNGRVIATEESSGQKLGRFGA